jgi:hypothetical protein
MDAYDMLAVYRDAVECLEELGKAGKLPPARSVFWTEFKAYSERATALWDNGPIVVELDPRTGQTRSPITDALMASLLFSQPFMPGDDVEGAAV